jgi:hypothetical protein
MRENFMSGSVMGRPARCSAGPGLLCRSTFRTDAQLILVNLALRTLQVGPLRRASRLN